MMGLVISDHPKFAGEKLSQALALGDFEWLR